ncbi:NAD(P)H:quinone oxidoreductase type IV [Sulfitobacter sp.]|jgi:NAD(P)H dehydrogenase (quinone)|uniref:NAD(P)H:quinone oxidoreductase type IV n=1 Tax=Sulfitobacter sp. TaxID=1903071 RepID=UPI000C0E8E06|nr:NAD(P)H:quinone oxidoreductase type IV [Roseobacter sp.]MBV47431.1 NAD(P)H:quinone oxidoreductase type IV [Roseobacter sp.]PHR09254.1 MAG: NAD(P)H:quinone oxidoreductase type IV [Sulfitobacter sp.]|tara:strand:+ start:303 stop:893 length:591 start_codon:yes stop_codon:yes gene_type:complete
MTVKLAIVYYSSYGTNHQMATIAMEAAKAAGADVRLLKARETAPAEAVNSQAAWKAHADATADIPEASVEDMEWADAYLVSAGTRFGVMASQMRAFIDTLGGLWSKGALANKPISAMTSAQNAHGGQETTLSSFYITAMHWGAIVVVPGYTDEVIFKTGGNPYGYSHTQGAEFSEDVKSAIGHQTRRLVEMAAKLA